MKGFGGHRHTEKTKKKISETLKARNSHGNSGSFQKGHTPWNKGKPMSDETKEKVLRTGFKKGHIPARTKPIGTERLSKDGYVEIKVSDIPNVSRCVNWRPKQLWIYEQHYNVKVDTRKEMVIFLDGDKRNFDIENLMLISRAENRIMNNGKNEYTFVKGNAEQTKMNVLQTRLRRACLDAGEKLGLVKNRGGGRFFIDEQREKTREYQRRKRQFKKKK